MSKLGNIQESYGKQFSIAIANTYCSNILNSTSLPKNSLIISSPFNDYTKEDLGTPALLITDNEGSAIILTKTIISTNGIVYNNDSLAISIDNKTIKENQNGELYVDFSEIIDSSEGLSVDQSGQIIINTTNLPKASKSKFGFAKVDGITINADNGTISVDTTRLDYATNDIHGIVIGDNKTIKIINGIPNVIISNLRKCGSNYGLSKVDNNTIKSDNGNIYVNEQSLVSQDSVGLIKVDNNTIISNNGVLSINYQNLKKANETTYGMIKYDNSQFIVSQDGKLSIKQDNDINDLISNISIRVQSATSEVDQIEEEISNL